MQPLTASPRSQYTAAQVTALLTAPDVHTDFGLELLTPALALVEDISADVASWLVRHNNLANVHGTIDLTISRALAWGAARVRPYKLLTSQSVRETITDVVYGTTRTNLCSNPALGSNSVGYIANAALTRVAQGAGWAASVDGSVAAYLVSPAGVAVTGEYWSARATINGPAGREVLVKVHDGVGYTTPDQTITLTGTPTEVSLVSTTPTTEIAPRVYFYPLPSSSWTAGEALTMTKVLLEKVSGAGVAAGAYFDGSTPSTDTALYSWTGTPNASTSTEHARVTTRTSVPITARFNQGVYLLTSPGDTTLGEDPITYTVTGYDQLHLLQAAIGDSYFVASGSNVLTAVRAALTAAGILAPVLLDSSSSAAVLASDMVFPLTSDKIPTWIRVVNDLLAAIYYRGIWADEDGSFRSGPYVTPAARGSEFTFAVGSLKTGIVAPERSVSNDVWGAANQWVGITNGLAFPPTVGNGKYITDNESTGLSSQDSVGRVIPDVRFYDAVDQASLVAQVDEIKAAAMRSTEVITARTSQMAIMGHADCFTWSDPVLGADRKAIARSWSLPSGTDDGDLILETIT